MKNNSDLMDKYIDPFSDSAKQLSLEFDAAKMTKRLESENLITTWSFRVTLGFFVSSSGRFVRGIPLQITEIFNYVIYNTYFWNLERIPDS